ncbi:MAG: peptidoglycan editing factor PgeF [Nannocystaceae bacterium]
MRACARHFPDDLCHGFSDRNGGVSEGRYASLNLSGKWGDDPVRVQENLRRLAEDAAFSPAALRTATQVHGVTVVDATEVTEETEADAIVATRDSGLVAGVRTADCVPVLLVDEAAGLCAAVHSGWRGTVGNIAGATVLALVSRGAQLSNLRAAIGPCISAEAFEVGPEVAERFDRRFVWPAGPARPRPHVDLRACVRDQLVTAGLSAAHIEDIGGCTCLESDTYFSYRRDGAGIGQQLSFAGFARAQT